MCCLVGLVLTGVLVIGVVPAAHAEDYTIVIDKMKFGPVPAALHPGDTITWRNNDIFRHSATARDKSFDIDLPSKASVRMAITKAAKVDFFCKFHPGMKGTLVISS
jgi:plastocyanin